MLASEILNYIEEHLESSEDCKLVILIDGKEVDVESIDFDENAEQIQLSN